jgi:hypothetical protein
MVITPRGGLTLQETEIDSIKEEFVSDEERAALWTFQGAASN